MTQQPAVHTVETTCPYCGVGCGIDVGVSSKKHQPATLEGSRAHPANQGRLCIKGQSLLETTGQDGRLLYPQIRSKRVSWRAAIDTVSGEFSRIIEEHGPDSVAFYVSGQLLTEDYYVANKLMKGFIGSANIDTNSRLCMSSAVSAYKRAFGADAVPCCYEDLEQTDLLILVGSNAAWTHPVLYQRMQRAKAVNPDMQVVVVDPRQAATAALADQHLALKPGSDACLFNGLLRFMAANDLLDVAYLNRHVEGAEQALSAASHWDIAQVASACDLAEQQVTAFYQRFVDARTAISFYSMGINQSTSGVDKANAIINCHLASGKIGKPGCGPFSITGQPNAMGGREVGGLASMLAAHMDLDNAEHRSLVQRYWRSPSIASSPGYKAVDLFDAIADGKVKAVWIMATNPLVSMPNRQRIEQALSKAQLVVVSDNVASNDTLNFAHVKLPASGWAEKNGTVTNSERCISRQRGLTSPPGEARHDWQIICDVAQAMGFAEGFGYRHVAEIFKEHAGLTGYQNNGQRALDLSALARMDQRQYERLRPVQWPVNRQNPFGSTRLFADGRFFTSSGKAKMLPIQPVMPQQATSNDYPFVLNSGRMRDHWHTMTRTGLSKSLRDHTDEPFVALHPQDAQALDVRSGQLVALRSAVCAAQPVILRARIESGQRKGECFAPIHWSLQQTGSATIARLYSSANDPISGQPELKHAAVALAKVTVDWYIDVLCRDAIRSDLLESCLYWHKIALAGMTLYRLAVTDEYLQPIIESMTSSVQPDSLSQRVDSRQACLVAEKDQRLQALVIANRQYESRQLGWFEHLAESDTLDSASRAALLRAVPDEEFSHGRLICSCFKVREKPISEAIQAGCDSLDALADELKCGSNCGSCRSELAVMLRQRSEQVVEPSDAPSIVQQPAHAIDIEVIS